MPADPPSPSPSTSTPSSRVPSSSGPVRRSTTDLRQRQHADGHRARRPDRHLRQSTSSRSPILQNNAVSNSYPVVVNPVLKFLSPNQLCPRAVADHRDRYRSWASPPTCFSPCWPTAPKPTSPPRIVDLPPSRVFIPACCLERHLSRIAIRHRSHHRCRLADPAHHSHLRLGHCDQPDQYSRRHRYLHPERRWRELRPRSRRSVEWRDR